MGITRNKELLETRQIKTRQIKFFELLVLSGKARTSFTRSALAQNSTSTILSTKQTTMFYERSSAEQHKSASTILSRQRFSSRWMVQNNIMHCFHEIQCNSTSNVTVPAFHFLFTVYRTAPAPSTSSTSQKLMCFKRILPCMLP